MRTLYYAVSHRLQWNSKTANMPVVYYGQQSGYYDHVRIVSHLHCTHIHNNMPGPQ